MKAREFWVWETTTRWFCKPFYNRRGDESPDWNPIHVRDISRAARVESEYVRTQEALSGDVLLTSEQAEKVREAIRDQRNFQGECSCDYCEKFDQALAILDEAMG